MVTAEDKQLEERWAKREGMKAKLGLLVAKLESKASLQDYNSACVEVDRRVARYIRELE